MAAVGIADQLLATLRRLSPVKVRVIDANDDTRDVEVPTRRRKWSQVIAAIEARPWVQCELLGKSGAVLGYVNHDGPASDVEDLSPAQAGGASRALERERDLGIMLKAQRTALEFRDAEHKALLTALTDMLKVNIESTKQLVALYQAQVELAAAVGYQRGEHEATEGDTMAQVLKLIEEAPEALGKLAPMLQLIMMRRKQLAPAAKGKPQAPTNGVNGAKQ